MKLSKIIPFLTDGNPKRLPKTSVPHNSLNNPFKFEYTESQGFRRNGYIRDTRAIASVSRTCQTIITGVSENTLGSKVDINFIKLQKKNELTDEERETIKYLWYKDSKNMVAGAVSNLFYFQKNIIQELCITGECFVIFCKDEHKKNLKK